MKMHRRQWMATSLAVAGVAMIGVPSRLATQAAPAASALDPSDHVFHGALPPVSTSGAALAFREEMRRLWEDHITWTRLYIVSFVADLPDLDQTAQRLLRNQTDIGDAIKPYYGVEAGDQLTALLEGHILGAVDLLMAARSGDQDAIVTASDNWYVNADQIATFLSQANPAAWPRTDLREQMQMHLDLTLEEATARLTGDFAADIAAYDEVHGHILPFADLLSSGIITQFPEKFA
jgi:hypothetical protein